MGCPTLYPEPLERLAEVDPGRKPAVNQIEIHPGFSNNAQREDNARRGIVTEAWSPLGQGQALDSPVVAQVARDHGVSPAQAILAWHLTRGDVVIPRSSNPGRIRDNLAVAELRLAPEELAAIDALDRGEAGRIGGHPEREYADTPLG